MNQADNDKPITITQETIYDLGAWLTDSQSYSQAQLNRLKDEAHYLTIISLANHYWLIGALAASLRQSPIWASIPVILKEYLTELETVYANRNLSIRTEVISTCALLQNAGLQVILLKGAANLFNGVAKPLSSRYMSDIDILVAQEKLDESIKILTDHGYFVEPEEEEVLIKNQVHHHAAPLIKDGGICYVELHRWVLPLSSHSILQTKEVWQNSITLSLNDDFQVLQLHPNQQVILAITHSEISDSAYEDDHIDLRQLFNLYSLAHRFTEEIDWIIVEHHFERADQLRVLHAMLFSAYKIFNLTTPITKISDPLAKHHFYQGIEHFLVTQGNNKKLNYLVKVIRGYRKSTMLDLYGNAGQFPILIGRVKHLKRHIKLLLSPHYLIRFVKRNLNRS